jgi:hypothetical protein
MTPDFVGCIDVGSLAMQGAFTFLAKFRDFSHYAYLAMAFINPSM